MSNNPITELEQDLALARLGDYPGAEGCKRIAAAFDAMHPPLPAPSTVTDATDALVRAVEPLALLFRDGGVNMNDPLSKWLTMANLQDAHDALAMQSARNPDTIDDMALVKRIIERGKAQERPPIDGLDMVELFARIQTALAYDTTADDATIQALVDARDALTAIAIPSPDTMERYANALQREPHREYFLVAASDLRVFVGAIPSVVQERDEGAGR